MKSAIKRQWLVIFSLLFVVSFSLLNTAPAKAFCGALEICPGPGPLDPVARPYLKVLGADVFAGGWFSHPTACATNSQDPSFADKQNWYGGIQTYANRSGSNSNGGASSQYGAFALGAINSDGGPPKGFYSSGAMAPTTIAKLSFSNNTALSPWGGAFQGSSKTLHCIPDYYSKKPSGATSLSEGTLPAVSDSYQATNSGPLAWNLSNGPVIIPKSAKISIYVDGNVYIGSNITYPSPIKTDEVPKFTLVVQGNIFIGASVTRLDGLYITQPHDLDKPTSTGNPAPADDGVIWTCHAQSTAEIDLTYPLSCNKKLVINGAVIAKQIHWLRIGGPGSVSDVALATTAEDGGGGSIDNARNSTNIAEVVNYTPEMVIGGSFFPTASPTYKIQSLIYLPPVF